MRIFKLMMIALVAMIGLNSCSEDCDHNFIEHDFTQDIVGTWTYVNGAQAEAMVIKADGSFTTTGVMIHGALYEEKGTIKVENNKVTLAFDGDKETFEGRLEFVAGKSLSLVMFDDNDVRLTYDYCKEDLSDEVVGMWVFNDVKSDMRIHTFEQNGSATFTGWSNYLNEFSVLENSGYKVIGDLLFQYFSNDEENSTPCIASRLMYVPNGNALGDMMYISTYSFDEEANSETITSWLRVKQNLNLAGQKYDYNNIYVSNVKGADKDIDFMGQIFNFSEMDGVKFDKMLKALLFSVEFPDANTLKYSCHFSHQEAPAVVEAPIAVDGNKMTIKVSEVYPGFKDVDVYTFQDQDNSQMHMYIPTSSVEAFFGNLQVMTLSFTGQLDNTDAEAVKAVYDRVDAAIESINLSIILK